MWSYIAPSLLIVRLVFTLNTDQRSVVEVISVILKNSKCRGIVVGISDGYESIDVFTNVQQFIEAIINQQTHPFTLLYQPQWTLQANNKDSVCQNTVIFGDEPTKLLSFYRLIKQQYFIDKALIVTQCQPNKINQLLIEIQNENLFVLLLKSDKIVELYTWKANNRTINTTLKSNSNTSSELVTAISAHGDLSGRHLMVATLSYPPAIVIETCGQIKGIEASLLEIMASRLQFTFDYVQASPNEMWGEILSSEEGDITFTGIMGMLARKEVDIASGQLYISSIRWPFIGYSVVYKLNYESFLVPAPKPYSKWVALIYSFTLPTWMATIGTSIVVVFMLRFVAAFSLVEKQSNQFNAFDKLQYCCLYVIGNLLNVQMQPQNIVSNANRICLLFWLFGCLILTTGYRSGLISYMTFPFTPPPVDTLQQLVDSPLHKMTFGSFLKDSLVNSTAGSLQRKLGEELIPHYNLTEMYLTLDVGSSAVQSNVDNLLYMAATMYPTSQTGPRVHLIKDTIVPVGTAFGLQKESQLKPYLDREILRLIEFGFVDYHTNIFAKKLDKWNPKKTNNLVPFSFNSLQGAFYLLAIGSLLSLLVFIAEIISKILIR